MNISSTILPKPNLTAARPAYSSSISIDQAPTDSVTFGSGGEAVLGVGILGAIGVGLPMTAAMGAAKLLASDQTTGLAVICGMAAIVGFATLTPASLGLVDENTDGINETVLAVYGGGAALATAGAAWGIFG